LVFSNYPDILDFNSWGWIINGIYYGADLITRGITGQSKGQHLDNAVGGPLVEW